MKNNGLEAQRAVEILTLQAHTPVDNSGVEAWNDEDIEENEKLSKGSDCCGADVRILKDQSQWCSKCSAQCIELFEDDDEYLERLETEARDKEDRQEFLDLAYEHLEEGGY